MNAQQYTWRTWYNGAKIYHQFSPRVQVTTDLATLCITLIKDDRVINIFQVDEEYSIEQYQQFLQNVAKSSECLIKIK
ncbi:MAG: hypothetical protein ACRCZB_08070 [Bacteroidales bacterium]